MEAMFQPSLFDSPFPSTDVVTPPKPTVEPNQPLANKIDSFYSENVQGKRKTQKERVFYAIQLLQPCSDYEISAFTEISRHLIPDRRGQLIKEGKVKISHSAICPHTKKTVTYFVEVK